MEIYNIKLKYTDINFVKAICGNPTPRFKIKIRLAHAKGNVCKDNLLQNKIVGCFDLPPWDVEIIFTYNIILFLSLKKV